MPGSISAQLDPADILFGEQPARRPKLIPTFRHEELWEAEDGTAQKVIYWAITPEHVSHDDAANRGLLHRDDGPAVIFEDGSYEFIKDGLVHRDQHEGPALHHVYADGTWQEQWVFEGNVHRGDDLPASVRSDGYCSWYRHGFWDRGNDLPARIEADGTQTWVIDDEVHREDDKPAHIGADGSLGWWRYNKKHRDGGLPACIQTFRFGVEEQEILSFVLCWFVDDTEIAFLSLRHLGPRQRLHRITDDHEVRINDDHEVHFSVGGSFRIEGVKTTTFADAKERLNGRGLQLPPLSELGITQDRPLALPPTRDLAGE